MAMNRLDNQITEMAEEDTQKGKYLIFHLAKESFAVEIRFVTEILSVQPVTPLPELPDYIRGIISLRGKIIPVMDTRIRFRKPAVADTEKTCIIILDIDQLIFGFIVDHVDEVADIPAAQIEPPPNLGQAGNRYVQGIGKMAGQVVLILDAMKMINEQHLETIQSSLAD